jgi:hypothetical protein
MKWEVKVHRRRALVHIGDAVGHGGIAVAVRHHRAELLHLGQPIADLVIAPFELAKTFGGQGLFGLHEAAGRIMTVLLVAQNTI